MRTTLSIDNDVLAVARRMAARQNQSVGEVISALTRQFLQPLQAHVSSRNGVPLLAVKPGGVPVTLGLVNRLRDELA